MSSAPVLPKGLTEFFFGECIDNEDAGRYQLQWNTAWSKDTKNKQGATGFAKIVQSSNDKNRPGALCRVHLIMCSKSLSCLWP